VSRFQNRDALLDPALDEATRRRRALTLDLFDAALHAVDPVICTRRALTELQRTGALNGPVTLFGFGKAVRGMLDAALLEVEVKRGIAIGFETGRIGTVDLLCGNHPVPSDDAPEHGQAILDLARSLTAHDTALVLVSGGGSALLEAPLAGLTLADLQATTRVLLGCGASIGELNAVRSALSAVKGGKLARAMARARVINVVLSDVIGSPLPSIASGPTVDPDPTLPSALDVVRRYALHDSLPERVNRALAAHVQEERSGSQIISLIAADNLTAQNAMLAAARARGFYAVRREAYLEGEARTLGPKLMTEASVCGAEIYVAGGETTVTLGTTTGTGGRNQELVLGAAANAASGVIASLGTDGIDGASTAAGALLDHALRARIKAMGLDVGAALENHDSGSLLATAGGSLLTGKTGTNVADVCLVIP